MGKVIKTFHREGELQALLCTSVKTDVQHKIKMSAEKKNRKL